MTTVLPQVLINVPVSDKSVIMDNDDVRAAIAKAEEDFGAMVGACCCGLLAPRIISRDGRSRTRRNCAEGRWSTGRCGFCCLDSFSNSSTDSRYGG